MNLLLRLFGITQSQSWPSPMERLRSAYIEGRIEVDEFERRLEHMLNTPTTHSAIVGITAYTDPTY